MFDFKSAKKEGYSDIEILDYFKQTRKDFDFDAAMQEGYSIPEIADYVAKSPVKAAPAGPAVQAEPYTPKPGDIKIDLPQPIQPGPYGKDIARQRETEKQNVRLIGEALPHGEDKYVRPGIAMGLNIASAIPKIPEAIGEFGASNYQKWQKDLDAQEAKATTPEQKTAIANERARMLRNKEVFEKAKAKAAPIIKPAATAISEKVQQAADVYSSMPEQAALIRKEFEGIAGSKPELLDDLANSVKLGKLDLQLDWFASQAAARGDKQSLEEMKKLSADYRNAQSDVKKAGIVREALRGVARMAPGLVGSMAATAIPVVGPAIAFSGWAAQGAGEVFNEAVQGGADPKKAAVSAAIAAPIYSAIEFLQIGKLKRIPQVKGAITKALAEYGIDLAKEVNEEGLQGITNYVAEEIAKGNTNTEEMARGAWKVYLENVKQSALSLAIVGAPAKAVSLYGGRRFQPSNETKTPVSETITPQNETQAQLPPAQQPREPVASAGVILPQVSGSATAPLEKAGPVGQGGQVGQEPTEAQKKAGNYKKEHIKRDGLDISIENPTGSTRSGTDKEGKQWSQKMNHDYGYIKGTTGKDKDHVDVFINPVSPEGGNVFIVDQVDPKTGRFDEHKVMMGFGNEAEARQAYLSNYEPGWQGIGAVTEMPMKEFKEWAYSTDTKKPLGKIGGQPGKTLSEFNVANEEAFWALPQEKRYEIFPQLSEDDKTRLLDYKEQLPPLPDFPAQGPAIPQVGEGTKTNDEKTLQTETEVAVPETQKRVTPELPPTAAPAVTPEMKVNFNEGKEDWSRARAAVKNAIEGQPEEKVGQVGQGGPVGPEKIGGYREITEEDKAKADKLIDGGYINLTKISRGKKNYYRLFDGLGNEQFYNADAPVVDYIKSAMPKTRLPVQQADLIGTELDDNQKAAVDAMVESGYKYAKLLMKNVGTEKHAQLKQVWKVYNDLGQAQYLPAEQTGVINYLKDKTGQVRVPAFRMAGKKEARQETADRRQEEQNKGDRFGSPQPKKLTREEIAALPEDERFAYIESLQARIETAETEAVTDPLTGLTNRRGLAQKGFKVESDPNIALDADYFKLVNDNHGHKTGDEVLKAIAATLTKHLGNEAVVARTGGEEFNIFPLNKVMTESILNKAANAQKDLAAQSFDNGKLTGITLSGGTGAGLEAADKQLYAAKHSGRARILHEGKIYGQHQLRAGVGEQPQGSVRKPESEDVVSVRPGAPAPAGEGKTGTAEPETRTEKRPEVSVKRPRGPRTPRPFERAFPRHDSVEYTQEFERQYYLASLAAETYRAFRNGYKTRDGVARDGGWPKWNWDYLVLADRPGKSLSVKQHKPTLQSLAFLQNIVDRIDENPEQVEYLASIGLEKPNHVDDIRGWLSDSLEGSDAPYQKKTWKAYYESYHRTTDAEKEMEASGEAARDQDADIHGQWLKDRSDELTAEIGVMREDPGSLSDTEAATLLEHGREIRKYVAENKGYPLSEDEKYLIENIDKIKGESDEKGSGTADMRAAEAAARVLGQELGREYNFDAGVDDVQVVVPKDQDRELQNAFVALLGAGRGPYFVRLSDKLIKAVGRFNGVTVDDQIFINADASMPVIRTVAHEAVHSMRSTNPVTHRGFMEFLDRNLTALGERAVDSKFKSLDLKTRRQALEEMAGDLLADNIENSRFWRMIYGFSPKLMRDLLDSLRKTFDKLLTIAWKSKLTNRKWFKDIVAVRRELARLVADTAAVQQGKMGREEAFGNLNLGFMKEAGQGTEDRGQRKPEKRPDRISPTGEKEKKIYDIESARAVAEAFGLEFAGSREAPGGPDLLFTHKRSGTTFKARTREDVSRAVSDLADRVAPKGTVTAGRDVRFSREEKNIEDFVNDKNINLRELVAGQYYKKFDEIANKRVNDFIHKNPFGIIGWNKQSESADIRKFLKEKGGKIINDENVSGYGDWHGGALSKIEYELNGINKFAYIFNTRPDIDSFTEESIVSTKDIKPDEFERAYNILHGYNAIHSLGEDTGEKRDFLKDFKDTKEILRKEYGTFFDNVTRDLEWNKKKALGLVKLYTGEIDENKFKKMVSEFDLFNESGLGSLGIDVIRIPYSEIINPSSFQKLVYQRIIEKSGEGDYNVPDEGYLNELYKTAKSIGKQIYESFLKNNPDIRFSRPVDAEQYDIFGGSKTQSEIEREEEERIQRSEVKRRQEARKGGEADMSGLPMFEDAEIEGSQQTLMFMREAVQEAQQMNLFPIAEPTFYENTSNGEQVETTDENEVEQTSLFAEPSSKPKPETKETRKPERDITDFGQKIGGARKDYYADYANEFEKAKTLDIVEVPLSKSWPEPDYKELLESGKDPWIVAFVRSARDEVPTKPSLPSRVRRWALEVSVLRGFADDLLNGSISKEALKDKLQAEQFKRLNSIVGGRTDLYETFGHGISLKGITLRHNHYYSYRGEKNVTKWQVEKTGRATLFGNMPLELGVGNTKEDAIESFRSKYDTLITAEGKAKNVDFVVYRRRDNNKFYIAKKIGARKYLELKEFESSKDALDYRAANQTELEEILKRMKEVPNERREFNRERVGKDHRQGKDVTPEMFSETFGFRGVEFGNWVNNSERQDNLNRAYDALYDLANVLNIPTSALSLNGELGIGFGSRGHGGKNAPAAHYESGKVVINLTRKNGPGSLAHEWWHAFDNYLSRRRGKPLEFMVDRPLSIVGDTTRPELVAAIRGVIDSINKTDLKKRSKVMDETRSEDYWSTPIEMAARAFENHVIGKLADIGATDDYLANTVSDTEWARSLADLILLRGGKAEDSYPYLTNDELVKVKPAFDALFNTLKTKEEGGKTVLFMRDVGQGGPVGRVGQEKDKGINFSRPPKKLGEPDYTPNLALEKPAEAAAKAKRTLERAKELQDEIASLRAQGAFRHATDGQLELRAELGNRLKAAELSEQEAEAVKQEIYDYAKALGLRGLPYNQVDTMLKSARTAGDLRKSIERLDRIWEQATRREAVKDLYDLIDRKYKKLRSLVSARRPSNTDLENNRLLKQYLDNLMGLNNLAERDHIDKMLTWMQREGPKAVKNKEYGELPPAVREWVEDSGKPLPDIMSNAIRGMFKDQIETMPIKRIREIIADILSIEETGKTAWQIRQEQIDERREKEAKALVAEIKVKEEKTPALEKALKKGGYEETRKRRTSLKAKADELAWSVRDIDRIGTALTGKTRGTAFESFVIRPMADAYSKWKRNMHRYEIFMNDVYGKMDMQKVRKEEFMKIKMRIPMTDAQGQIIPDQYEIKELPITLEAGMFIYAHSKNKSQREHLVATIDRNDREFANGQINQVIAALPQEYKDAVEKQWEYFAKVQWDQMNEVFSQLRQIDMDREENYFPVNNLDNAFNDETIEVDLMARAARQASVRAGATESRIVSGSDRTTSAASPFRNMLYFDAAVNNMRQAAHYNAMAVPVYETQKNLGNAAVSDAIDRVSPKARAVINDWLKSLAYGKWSYNQSNSILDTMFRYLRSAAGSYQILGRVSSLLIQASSMPRGMVATKKKYLARAIGAMISERGDFFKLIDEKSANMATRTQEYEQAISEYLESTDGKRVMKALGVVDVTREFLGKLIGGVDKFWASLVWFSRYSEAINDGAKDEDAVYEADKTVRKTQSGGGLFAANALQRGNDVSRAFTQFLSDAIKATNQLDEYIQGFKDLPNAEKINYVVWGMLLPAAIVHLIRSGFEPWREPEEGLKEFIMQNFYSIPFLGQLMELGVNIGIEKLKRARGIIPNQGWKQYAMEYEAPAASMFAEFGKNTIMLFDAKRWREKPVKNIFVAIDMVAQAMGLPGGGQLKRVSGGMEEVGKTGDLRYLLVSKAALQSGNEMLQKQSYAMTNFAREMKLLKTLQKDALQKGNREKAARIAQQRADYFRKHFKDVQRKEMEFREKKKAGKDK